MAVTRGGDPASAAHASTGQSRRADEQQLIDAATVRALDCIPALVRGEGQKAMHRLHTGNPASGAGTDDAGTDS